MGARPLPTYTAAHVLILRRTRLGLLVFVCLTILWANDLIAAPLSGVVYDAKTGDALPGVRLQLFYDASDSAEPGLLVPAERLRGGEQDQVTGSMGRYAFDLPGGRVYQLRVTSRSDHYSFPSTIVAPNSDFPRFGDISPDATPQAKGARTFYMRFDTSALNAAFRNNHIAVDRFSDVVSLTLKSDRLEAGIGDVLGFVATLRNDGMRALSAAEGHPTYLLFIAPRGLSVNLGSASAEVLSQDKTTGTRSAGTRADKASDRLVRFGPFDVPAGAELRLRFQASVGIDHKAGQSFSRLIAQDGGGVALSNEASARVVLTADRDFSSSTIVGRTFCDSNANGSQEPNEPGVFGARIYADTGAVASSDTAGRFHFTRVEPGSHLFKIDTGSIAGASVLHGDKRLLLVSEGLPMQLRFPVKCVTQWISSEHARIILPLASIDKGAAEPEPEVEVKRILVRGQLSPMTLEINGIRQDLPSLELKLNASAPVLVVPATADAGPLLRGVPAGGYSTNLPRWSLIWTDTNVGRPLKWRFTIERVEANGRVPVYHRDGDGAPPAIIDWNGLSDAETPASSAVHVARVTLVTADGREIASRREAFGVGLASGSNEEMVATGSLFSQTKNKPEIAPELHLEIEKVVAKLGATGTVDIAVHGDGSGDRLKSLVQTQREANRLQALVVSLGVDASRVRAHGRGAAEPVDNRASEVARHRNRRVVVSLSSVGGGKSEVPLRVTGKRELRLNGQLVPVDTLGGFSKTVPANGNGWLTVDMLASSGRRIAFRIHVTSSASQAMGSHLPSSSAHTSKRWRIAADLSAKHLQIDFDTAPAELWTADLKLASVDSLPVPEIFREGGTKQRELRSPLDFQVVLGETLSVRTWTLYVEDASGVLVHRQAGEGRPPAVLRWDGQSGESSVLQADQVYKYWLNIETADASSLSTAPHWFHVDPKRSAKLVEHEGRLFSRSGVPRASLRNRLSRFAVLAKRAPAQQRYSMVVEVAGDSARVNSVRAELVRYIARLGIDGARYDLTARERVGRRDRLSIVTDLREPQVAPSLRINNQEVALQKDAFDSTIELGEGEPLVVEVLATNGRKLRYVGNASQPSPTSTAGGELIAPSDSDVSEVSGSLDNDNGLASDTPARSLRVLLPPKNSQLGDPRVAIVGEVAPGTQVQINSQKIVIDRVGRFSHIATLPVGKSEIVIRADDSLGGSSTIRWPLRVKKSHSVVVAQIEGIAASSYGREGFSSEGAVIAGMAPSSTLQVGPVLLSARAKAFVKARVPGGAFADTVDITAQVDTGRERAGSSFFRQEVDPRRDAPVLGDEAAELQDANTRGKLYAHVKAGESEATIGSVHTRLKGGGELFEYDRSADGAVADVHKSVGRSDVAVRAFTSTDAMTSSRDSNWFRATGGTLFYLRHGHVLEGTEVVRVVIRDRDSGMALEEVSLREGVDYNVDYPSGRIQLAQPLSGASASTWVLDNMNTSTTPMSGHLVYLNVSYEHEDQDGLGQQARGAYVSTTIEERLSLGAGVVSEERDGQEGYRLTGADVSLNIGKRSNLRAEIAASRQRDAGQHLSMDGGLSFGDLQRDTAFDATGSDRKLGWKLSADFAVGDWSEAREFQDTGLSMYVQNLERGFASGDSVLDQGRLKFGGRLQHRLSSIDRLLLRHEGQIAKLPRVGPTRSDVMANPSPLNPDETASYLTSIQWARDAGVWHYKVEGMHQRLTSTAALVDGSAALDARRVGVGVLTAYEYSERLTLRVGQQLVSSSTGADPVLSPVAVSGSSLRSEAPLAGVVTSVGSDFQLAPDLSVSGDLFQRWNGDNAVRVGLRTALSDRGSMYVQEQVGGVDGRLSNATVIGAEDRFGTDGGGRSYGEYQVNRGVLGTRNRAVMGLGRLFQVTRHTGVGFGFEHQQAFGGYLPDGTSIGDAQRNAVHSSMSYRRKNFRVAAQLELRLDHGDEGRSVDEDVLGEDSREGVAPGGFADHGGVAPGAALVIAPGAGTQWVGGVVGEWRVRDAHSWLGRARSSLSSHRAPGAESSSTIARFTELTTGWAFRPRRDDRFEVITRYSYLVEERPLTLTDLKHTERSHVVALLPFARLPHQILLSAKLAVKHTRARDLVPELGASETHVNAILVLARVGYQFYGNWDASAEVRQLTLLGAIDSEMRFGSLLELGYTLSRQLRLAGGYNFGRLSDNELGDLTRDSHGVFMRMTGMY